MIEFHKRHPSVTASNLHLWAIFRLNSVHAPTSCRGLLFTNATEPPTTAEKNGYLLRLTAAFNSLSTATAAQQPARAFCNKQAELDCWQRILKADHKQVWSSWITLYICSGSTKKGSPGLLKQFPVSNCLQLSLLEARPGLQAVEKKKPLPLWGGLQLVRKYYNSIKIVRCLWSLPATRRYSLCSETPESCDYSQTKKRHLAGEMVLKLTTRNQMFPSYRDRK